MKILVLTPEFLPLYGGVGTYVVELVRNLPQQTEVHVLAPRRAGCETDPLAEELPKNVSVEYVGGAKDTFFHNFSFQWDCLGVVPKIVKDRRIDLVHSQSAMPDFLVPPKRIGVPVVTTIHTTIEGHIDSLRDSDIPFSELRSSERFALLLGPGLRLLEDRYYASSRYYLTVSEWALKEAVSKKKIAPDRIRVIYTGVDAERFSPSKRPMAKEHLPRLASIDSPRILFLSRMATRKGIHELVRAIPRVLERVDAHFIFAGTGALPPVRAPKENYTCMGYVDDSLPPFLYAFSDIFILPSYYENFPLTIMEAMASGCAVVSTNVCGIPEMVDHESNGLLIPPKDDKAIADALTRLIEDGNLRRKISERGRKTVLERFSWKDTATKTNDYYAEIIDRVRK